MATTIEDAGAARPTQIRVRIIEGRPFVSDFPFRLKSGAAWPTAPVLHFNGPSGVITWTSTLSDGGKLATVTATKAEVDTLLGHSSRGIAQLDDPSTGRLWAAGDYFAVSTAWAGGTAPTALADGAVVVDDRLVIMGGEGGTGGPVSWAEVTGKPSSYPPSLHSHTATDLSGVVKTVNGTAPDGSGNVTVATGSGTPPDATTSQKGIVQLAGDLAGTADNPTVPGLAGKASTTHTHAAADVTSGTLNIARIPTGTTSTMVALGNHTHSGYAPSAHNHDTAYAAKSAELGRYIGVNAQTGTTYTPVVADEGKLVTLSNAAAITVTLPADAVAIPVGGSIDFTVIGVGMATFVAGSGASVNGTPSLVTRAQWSTVTCIKRAANAWLLVGDLADA